jgi:hypothetical protein
VGNCSLHYGPAVGDFFGQFKAIGPDVSIRLSISDVSAIPEPGTWALLLVGAFGASVALRRRRHHISLSRKASSA